MALWREGRLGERSRLGFVVKDFRDFEMRRSLRRWT